MTAPRLKVTSFSVRASAEQARRWARVAQHLRYPSVAAWLEDTAEQVSRRVESFLPPPQ